VSTRRTSKRTGNSAKRGPRGQEQHPNAEDGAPSSGSPRGRPGRRTVQERHAAVLELLSGKASVDQIAKRLGVLPATVEGWRQDAVAGMAEALRRGTAKSERERELERENKELRSVLSETAISKALLEQALKREREQRPFGPKKSRR
jgi:transposase-like protein